MVRFALPKGGELFLLGTAHVSEQSALEVQRAVNIVKPDVLLVELCRARAGLMLQRRVVSEEQLAEPEVGLLEEVKKTFASQQGLSGLFNVLLSRMYKKLSKHLKVMPGAEFIAALEAVKENRRPCSVVLGDRDISTTIQRAWAKLPLLEKLWVVSGLVRAGLFMDITAEDVERMKDSDVLASLVMEFGQTLPTLTSVLLSERDVYLAKSIAQCQGNRVVAVVGLAHCKGIQETLRRWESRISNPEDDCRDLNVIPKTPFTARRLVGLFAVVLIVLMVMLFFGMRFVWRLIF